MKRLFLSAIACVALVPAVSHGAAATAYYENSGRVSATYPEIGPRIDAESFVNYGQFAISNYDSGIYFGLIGTAYPYETWNTLNYTNTGIMAGLPGFKFDFKDSADTYPFAPKTSANFHNGSSVNTTNSYIYGERMLLVEATNVVNTGMLQIGATGVMRVHGDNVDLSRGVLSVSDGYLEDFLYYGSLFYGPTMPGVNDLYWGTGTNRMTGYFSPTLVQSSQSRVTMFDGIRYSTNLYSFLITSNITAYVNIAAVGPSNTFVDMLILGSHNPAVTAEVRFDNLGGPSWKAVRWSSAVPDTGAGVRTNQLFLFDTFISYDPLPGIYSSWGRWSRYLPATARPENYWITRENFYWDFMTDIPASTVDASIFVGTNNPMCTYAAYGAKVTAEPFIIDTSVYGATYSNVPGRIEVLAKDFLDLANTRVYGAGYLNVESPKQFNGNQGAELLVPYMSFKLGTTNPVMNIAGLVPSTIDGLVGEIEVWTGSWTNSGNMGRVLYNVTVVDGRLDPGTTPHLDNFELHSPSSIVISDSLHIMDKMLIDTERLTVSTNSPINTPATGEIHLLNNNLVWGADLPRLKYMTNSGLITSSNTLFFAGTRMPPWFTATFEEPYNAFVNNGTVIANGIRAWASYYENTGTNLSAYGPITAKAVVARVCDSHWEAPNADITIQSGSLLVTNSLLSAGRVLTLDVSDYLSDGSLENQVAAVTNKNSFSTGAGIRLAKLPPWASLLATAVTNIAYPYSPVASQWAGADKGCVPEGFVNNAALGMLVLDGGSNSVFRFGGVGGNNALYVDRLELNNFAGVTDTSGERPAVQLMPGFKLYFAQATANGLDISERLNGKSGGQFCWVSSYPGYYSGTNMVYPDGTTNRVNAALAQSCDLDSDGDGYPNCSDSSPVSSFFIPPVVIVTPSTNNPPGDGGTETNTPPDNGLPKLDRPEDTVPYSGLPTTVGSYYGLFYDTAGVSVASAGSFKLLVSSRGTYSGKVEVSGKSYVISGRLIDGAGSNYISRLGTTPLRVTFTVDDSGYGKTEGTVTDGTWTSQLVADRLQPGTIKSKSPFAGRYTMVIPPVNGSGCGYGTVLVTTSGTAVWSGRFGDGSKGTQTVAVSREGVWPLYASLSAGQGLGISWMQLSTNNMGGKLIWIKTGSFTNEVNVTLSRYSQPRLGQRAIQLFPTKNNGHGRLAFVGGGLEQSITNSVILNNANLAVFPKGSHVTLQIVPGTGLFQGMFLNPATRKPVSFRGALIQDQNFGAGQFTIGGLSGQVYLTEPSAGIAQ